MFDNNYSSLLLNNAVNEFAKLPGIGKKTALRLVLYLLRQDVDEVRKFSSSVLRLKEEIKYCSVCNNISDSEICSICSDLSRNNRIICVVENLKDIIAIENTQQYNGLYHVLGGIISPMDGIGPDDLFVESLVSRVRNNEAGEVILALNTTMEGETTCFYIYKKLAEFSAKITTIARGVAFGDELEYTDEITLGRSIMNRVDYKS